MGRANNNLRNEKAGDQCAQTSRSKQYNSIPLFLSLCKRKFRPSRLVDTWFCFQAAVQIMAFIPSIAAFVYAFLVGVFAMDLAALRFKNTALHACSCRFKGTDEEKLYTRRQ